MIHLHGEVETLLTVRGLQGLARESLGTATNAQRTVQLKTEVYFKHLVLRTKI